MAKQESQLFVRDFCKIGWLNFQSSHECSFSISFFEVSFNYGLRKIELIYNSVYENRNSHLM